MKFRFIPACQKNITILVWILRIVVGMVFILSGFVKCVDPWGSMYKFAEYFFAWDMDMPREITLVMSSGLAVFEFALGVLLIFGAMRRTTAWLLGMFMTVMTIITVYIYVADPVSDCGCFGDALIISNGATLLKNVALDIAVIYLVMLNGRVAGLISKKVQWLVAVFSAAYCVSLEIVGYHSQPVVDWRPYGVGTDISAIESEPVNLDGMKFIYEKDGVRKAFDADDIPEDDTWEFIERKSESNSASISSTISVMDADDNDVSGFVFAPGGKKLLLIVSDPIEYGLSRSHQANTLYEASNNIDSLEFIAIIASDYPGGINGWSEKVHANYPVYQAEDTDLKMLARGDAALVYLDKGTVKWKYNVFHFGPRFADDFKEHSLNKDNILENIDSKASSLSFLKWTTFAFAGVLILLIVVGRILTNHKKQLTLQSEKTETDV